MRTADEQRLIPKVSEFRNKAWPIVIILFIAAAFRLYEIDQPFVDATSWRETDVASVADNYFKGNWNILYPEISWNGPGPCYQGMEFQTVSYTSAMLYRIFGPRDWIGRSVSVLFSLWGILAFYKVAIHVWNWEAAVSSAAILMILPGEIYIDRLFIPDPVMLSLVMTSMWLLIKYLKSERLLHLVLASAAGALGFLTKLPGLIAGIPMLYLILSMRNSGSPGSRKTLLRVSAAIFLILLIVLSYYLWARHLAITYPPYHFTGQRNWIWDSDWQDWLEQKYFLALLYTHLKDWFWTKPIIFLVAIGLLLPPPRLNRNSTDGGSSFPARWFFHYWILAFVIYYFVGAGQLVGNPTNLNILNPAAAAIAGNMVAVVASRAQRKAGFAFVAVLMSLAVISIGFAGYKKMYGWGYTPYAKNSYELGLALRKISGPSDLVVTMAQDLGDPVAIYYSNRKGWVFPPAETWTTLNWGNGIQDHEEAIRLLDNLRSQHATWFGIVKGYRTWKENEKFTEYLNRTYLVKESHTNYVIYNIGFSTKSSAAFRTPTVLPGK